MYRRRFYTHTKEVFSNVQEIASVISGSDSIYRLLCTYVPSFAEDIDIPADEPLNTEFQHIDTIVTDLKIKGGTAYVGVQVIGTINHTTKIEVTATLQKKSGTKWNNVKTWNKTENNN